MGGIMKQKWIDIACLISLGIMIGVAMSLIGVVSKTSGNTEGRISNLEYYTPSHRHNGIGGSIIQKPELDRKVRKWKIKEELRELPHHVQFLQQRHSSLLHTTNP